MKKSFTLRILILFLLLFGFAKVKAQVTIGSDAPPKPHSVLELYGEYKTGIFGGLRLPQLSTLERESLTGLDLPESFGLMIYNTDSNCVEYWNNHIWVSFCDDKVVPQQPGAMVGADTVCLGSTNLAYSVPKVEGITYTWKLPAGWIQTGGGNTNSITVTAGNNSGTITVTPSNNYGNGPQQTLFVTVIVVTNSTPSPASVTLCPGTTQRYFSNSVSGVTYQWQSSTDNATWADIPGATAYDYTATAVAGTTIYYRRNIIHTCGVISSGSVSVTGTNAPCASGTFPITPVAAPVKVYGVMSGGNLVGSSTPTDSLTITFMNCNLGANAALNPKQQMAYPGCTTDITVFGGWYQWGRGEHTHTFRCDATPNPAGDSRFSTTLVPNTGTPSAMVTSDHGKFVYNSSNWTDPAENNSNLWGNGLSLGGGGNNPVKGLNDPCPPGWRVPTQHEWALLGWEGGSMISTTGDNVTISNMVTLAKSGLYWVKVNNGVAAASFLKGNMCGYALYDKKTWDIAVSTNPGYATGASSLTADAAPMPLMFFPAAGQRANSGLSNGIGIDGYYWFSTVSSTNSVGLKFQETSVTFTGGGGRAYGFSVRCVEE